MAVISLAIPANPINNNLTVVNLPLTQNRTSPSTNTLEFGYPLYDPVVDTANIVSSFGTKLDNRFFNQLFVDGGTA